MKPAFRVALGGFHIESASSLPAMSTLYDFEQVALRGADCLSQLRGTNSVFGGFIEVLEHEAIEPVAIVHTKLGAVGPATDEAVEFYAEEIAAAVAAQAHQLDGVLLFLHGACWAPAYTDPEAFIISRVRNAIGADKPLIVAFDYHGNLDESTIAKATAAFSYRLSPHVDAGETGQRAARCMARTLRGEIQPVCALAKPGVLVPSIFSATALQPLASVIKAASNIERADPNFIDITVMAGFSYGDSHNTGFSVLCNVDGDKSKAQNIADALARRIYEERRDLYRPLSVHSVGEAIDRVITLLKSQDGDKRPIVLLEHADRMNDSTHVLRSVLNKRALLEAANGRCRVAVPFIWDPDAARLAQQAGVGNTVRLSIGGHSSDKAGPSLEVEARVVQAEAKRYRVEGEYMHGMPVDLGVSALLDVHGIWISVVSTFAFAVDADAFTVFGQKPGDFDVIVLRSKTHFRAYYEQAAREIIIVDTPDHGTADLTQLLYTRLDTTRVYPFSDEPRAAIAPGGARLKR